MFTKPTFRQNTLDVRCKKQGICFRELKQRQNTLKRTKKKSNRTKQITTKEANKAMGCNTSQEQQSAVSENNGDIVNHNNDSKQTPRNSAKSEKESKSARSTKSTKNEKSDKLTNGQHENKTDDDQKSEGMISCVCGWFPPHTLRTDLCTVSMKIIREMHLK